MGTSGSKATQLSELDSRDKHDASWVSAIRNKKAARDAKQAQTSDGPRTPKRSDDLLVDGLSPVMAKDIKSLSDSFSAPPSPLLTMKKTVSWCETAEDIISTEEEESILLQLEDSHCEPTKHKSLSERKALNFTTSAPNLMELATGPRPEKANLKALSTEMANSWCYDRKPKKQHQWVRRSCGEKSKYWCLKSVSGIQIADGVTMGANIELRTTAKSSIVIEANSTIGDRTIIQAAQGVVVGRGSTLGTAVLVMDRNHHGIGCDKEIIEQVVIGPGAFIGDYSVILPGAEVAAGQKVPIFSVVTRRRCVECLPAMDPDRIVSSRPKPDAKTLRL